MTNTSRDGRSSAYATTLKMSLENIIGEAEATTVSVTPATALSAGSTLSFPVRHAFPVLYALDY
jgi:hypothetical protein